MRKTATRMNAREQASGERSADKSLFAMYLADARSVQRPGGSDPSDSRELIESHLFYVVQVAREYRNFGIALEDLLAEGNLGLIEAAGRFDRTRGVKFISYATWWIRKRIWELISRQASIVRLPKYKQERLRRMRSAEKELRSTLGRDPSLEEIADAARISLSEAQTLAGQSHRDLSLETILNEESGLRLFEVLSETRVPSPDGGIARESAALSLIRYLDNLPARQRKILAMHYGLGGVRASTLADIGRVLGVSRERVRQLERQGIARLRRMLETDGHLSAA